MFSSPSLFHARHQAPCLNEMAGDGVEHTVDVAAALRGGVELGNVDELVDGDADGNGGEGHHLSDGYLHNDDVHVG